MRKLSKYLIVDFLVTFFVAFLLITFAFSIGGLYKAIDYISKGIPVAIIGKFVLYNLPYSFAYTIPISSLFATLLLFGRLSSDSEIGAMRSGGLSLWQIAAPITFIAVLMVAFSFYNNCIVYPKTTSKTQALLQGMGVENPIKLLEEGRFIRDFPGYMIYVGRKNRNRVKDLVVYEVEKDSGKVIRTIRAESGIMTSDNDAGILKIDLFNARVEMPDEEFPADASKTRYFAAESIPIRVNFKELMGSTNVRKKRKNMSIFELIYRARNPIKGYGLTHKDVYKERVKDKVEISQRICLSISPLMFVMVAIPLGISSHRKESSIGMLMSLGIMFIYYIFIILSDTFDKKPDLYPWLIPWIPIVLGQIGGLIMMRRAD